MLTSSSEFVAQGRCLAFKRRADNYRRFLARIKEIEDNDSWVYKKAVKRGGRTRSVKCLLAH